MVLSVLDPIEQLGIGDILIPFIIVFTIVYLTLQKTKILGEGKKGPNVIFAMVMGLGVIIPHLTGTYSPCWDFVDIINRSLGKIAIGLVVVVTFLIILVVIGSKAEFSGKFMGWAGALAAVFVVYAFLSSRGPECGDFQLGFVVDNSWIGILIAVGIFIFLGWLMTREGGGEGGIHVPDIRIPKIK